MNTLTKPTSLTDEIAYHLEQKIRQGEISAGQKLPSETQLRQQFSVSRNVIREALARLKSNGLIESRQGSGAFVLPAESHQHFRIIDDAKDLTALRKRYEIRLETEVAAASMAARRRTQSQLLKLQRTLDQLRDHGLTEHTEHDLQTQVAAASANNYLEGFLAYLNGREPVSPHYSWQNAPRQFIEHWQEIIDAIALGDPDLARRHYWRYLLSSAELQGIRGLQGWERTRMSGLSELYAPLCAPALASERRPRLPIPVGACDSHMHVFWPDHARSFTPHRSYTPPPASLESYLAVQKRLGISRAVIVQPSVYGTDNHVVLESLRQARRQQGEDAFRGVVVIPPNIRFEELEAMHLLGVRGVRVNLLFKSGVAVSDLRTLANKIAPLGWHLQLLADLSEFSDIESTLGALPVPVVIDHMGHIPPELGPQHPGFSSMLRLLATGKIWVKLSGAERLSGERWPYTDVRPLAESLLRTNPERLLWASDWPHTCLSGAMPDDADLLDLMEFWTDDRALQHRVLVENPAALYGFASLPDQERIL
ncbi:amidohydrolase family protein [Pokkaliibacter sp. CJK22405]|uniref:amidohydrolase family protein n=1 Tax=Pokkaliibacter sp. CJK22405 TaxID=3384615 RepID=UPI003984A541